MVTVVVTAVDIADPTLLTVTAMLPVELVLQVVGVIAMLRSGPFTICTVADARTRGNCAVDHDGRKALTRCQRSRLGTRQDAARRWCATAPSPRCRAGVNRRAR